MTSASPVVPLALGRNDDDQGEREGKTEEHRILRRVLGTSSLRSTQAKLAFAREPSGEVLAKPTKINFLASKRLLRHLCGSLGWVEIADTQQSVRL